MNRRYLVFGAATASAAVFAGAAWYFGRSPEPVASIPNATNDPMVRPYSPVIGPPNAAVTIVEFFDPACEACRAFHPIVKQIVAAFPGKVRVVLRYTAFHPSSKEAITILETARLQGVFAPVLEALLDAQPRWAPHGRTPENAWAFAEKAGLNIARAKREANSPTIISTIDQDAADVASLGIRGTPTFFVNGKPLPKFGAQQLYDLVKQEVDAL